MTSILAATNGFGADHIALTAAITGVLALAAAVIRLPRGAWADAVAIGVLTAASVFLFRISANMPQLNDDGLPGFSANDWLAPVATFVFLSVYLDLRAPAEWRRFAEVRAVAVVFSLVVNVVTI